MAVCRKQIWSVSCALSLLSAVCYLESPLLSLLLIELVVNVLKTVNSEDCSCHDGIVLSHVHG